MNWYNGMTWQFSQQDIAGIIATYGNTYSRPESAGGFQDDPVAWTTEGDWNSTSGLVNLETHQPASPGKKLGVHLPGYGYQFYEVKPFPR